ncbi:MAG: PEP-CTERM sorting domain-containing protein [Phycisphaerales bacterium]
MDRVRVRASCAGALMLLLTAAAASAQSFNGVGFLDGVVRESYAWGISPSGNFVVGESSSTDSGGLTEAFQRNSEGLVALGALQPSNFLSVANDCTDNFVIVGFSRYGTVGTLFNAFRATDTLIDASDSLGDLPGGSNLSSAQAVSADGNVTVGFGSSDVGGMNRRQAFAHFASTGMLRPLGTLPGDDTSTAYAVSADGTRIAGQSSISLTTRAVVWTVHPDTTITAQHLPAIAGGFDFAQAWGISGDGMVVVGDSDSPNGTEACKWIGGQVIGLGDLPGGEFNSSANDASADGSIIVGYGTSETSGFLGEAVFWDADGVHSIRDTLVNAGQDLTGWSLQVANAVSADGRTIVGNGTDPDGNPQGWIAVLPEPNPCLADFNQDGNVDADDLGDFINCYFALPPCPGAEFNGDGNIDADDLGDFINTYFGVPC